MFRITLHALCLAALLCVAGPLAALELAPLDEALTFARYSDADGPHILAVRRYGDDAVSGVLLDALRTNADDDAIDLHGRLGYAALATHIAAADSDGIEVPLQALDLPVRLTDRHIAAGTNFAAHAEESEVEDGPFLFLKWVEPTPWQATVSAGDALLDYEVELSFVTLEPVALDSRSDAFGVIASNDLTNRAALLRHVNVDDPTTGDGFTTGKSAPGYLPVGNLFVIPADPRAFVADMTVQLHVNGTLRQSAPMSWAIWDLDAMIAETRAQQDTTWAHDGGTVRLPIERGAIPARTLLMTGTPAGTVFQGVPTTTMIRGAVDWLLGGWDRSVVDNVIERVIANGRASGAYLQPGDQVTIELERLGEVRTQVVP